MVAISTLKCLVTPVMVFNIIIGALVFISFIGYFPAIAILFGGFYILAGVFGLVGMKPGKKWAFVVFIVLETLLSIGCLINCIAVFGDTYYYDAYD
mmetsp:Transcript_808/g.91  ORF Transcript_808/g.91 Transcript_808/m.91 type:complete len:96 (-) Transcript_808:275-562(-)